MKKTDNSRDKIRMIAIVMVSLVVLATGALFATNSFMRGNKSGGIGGIIIAIIILAFALFVFKRGNSDIKKGLPLQDERSKRVMQKAMSMSFLVSLYLLLAIGFLSDDIIKFRDISQATSIAVGGMALLFAIFWLYYNSKGDIE